MKKTTQPSRPNGQLLKWIGNKFRYANEIVTYFPTDYGCYYEPFVGTGAILATLQPKKAIASDSLSSLIELWNLVQTDSNMVSKAYRDNWKIYQKDKHLAYNKVKDSFNKKPNGLDLLFISRTCYGGVLRFTKNNTISTPIGPHKPMHPDKFDCRLQEWKQRTENCKFELVDYKISMRKAKKNDLIYCDPPYKDSQTILYGAQTFDLDELFAEIDSAKKRGAKIALSIDGIKKSGSKNIELGIPDGLFEREVLINCGHSMLRRFQKDGEIMEGEEVKDRLLLTW